MLPKLEACKGKVVRVSSVMKSRNIKEVREKMYAANRNANKKLRRREAVIAQQIACIKSQQQQIKMHRNKLQGANHQVSQLRTKLNRVNHRALYWKDKVKEIIVRRCTVTKSQHDYIVQLKKELASLESDNAEMAETLEICSERHKCSHF